MKIADIGDILLFRGKNIGAKITRTFTVSKFGKRDILLQNVLDHVAMVLRFDAEDDQLFFFDATANVNTHLPHSLLGRSNQSMVTIPPLF